MGGPCKSFLRRVVGLHAGSVLLGAACVLGAPAAAGANLVPAQSVCPTAPPGHVRCAAEVLALRANGSLPRSPAHSFSRDLRLPGPRLLPASLVGVAPPQPNTAAFLQQAYDLGYLSATRGTSDTVAVVDAFDDPTAEADLATFRAANGLPPCTVTNGCLVKVNQQGAPAPLPATDSSWQVEEAADLAAVSALCPNCHILLVEAFSTQWSDLMTGMQTAARMGANQISASWTMTSSSLPPGQLTFPGVAVIAASGDTGFVGSGAAYPAAAPGVTAAGGTSLQQASGVGNPRGFVETAWSGAGSGCDITSAKPAFQTSVLCPGRAYADVSADADPNTGLAVYSSARGGWMLAGGTSLSTPLIAAFEAVTGVDGTTPAWAYADSAALNDPVSGANGSCAPNLAQLCVAGVGYDGPTGAGSISGQVVTGAPGIGAAGAGYIVSLRGDSASLSGGAYPNGLATTVWWQYGPTAAFGQSTAPVDIGSGPGVVAVPGVISGLQPLSTSHYRLVARNADGTSYGYDYTLSIPAASQAAGHAPDRVARHRRAASKARGAVFHPRLRFRGRVMVRRPLEVGVGGMRLPGHHVSLTWQIRRGRRWLGIRGAHRARFRPTAADIGHRLRVVIKYTNLAGRSARIASAPSAPVTAARRWTISCRAEARSSCRSGGAGALRRRAGAGALRRRAGQPARLRAEGPLATNASYTSRRAVRWRPES